MKKKTYFGLLGRLALAAGLAAPLAPTLTAATFQYNPGDLLIAFRQSGSPDLVVNAGPASGYESVTGSLTVSNLSLTQLGNAFASLDDLTWSASAFVRSSPLANTAWVTAPRADINTAASAWTRQGPFTQGAFGGYIEGIGNGAAAYSSLQPTGTNNTTTGVLIPANDNNSYTTQIGAGGNFNLSFQGNVENTTSDTFDTDGLVARSDLYRLDSGSGTGKYLGYFEFAPDGSLNFFAGVPPPPPPTILGINRTGNVTTISFTTVSSVNYRLRITDATGLTTPIANWSTNGSVLGGTGISGSLQDTNGTDHYYAVEAFR